MHSPIQLLVARDCAGQSGLDLLILVVVCQCNADLEGVQASQGLIHDEQVGQNVH
jgi:hypothetical protein